MPRREKATRSPVTWVSNPPVRLWCAGSRVRWRLQVLERSGLLLDEYDCPHDDHPDDLQTNKLFSARISSYVDSPEDKVSLNVLFSNLQDGTNYAAQTTVDAPNQTVRVLVKNSGHRWAG